MKITLSPVSPNDIDLLLELEQEASSKYYHAYTKKADIQNYIDNSNIFLVKNSNEVLGSISYEDKGSGKAYFDGLITRKSQRGKGVASNAMERLFKLLRNKSFKSISLLTHPHNSPALRLYLKIGFVLQSWVDNPFGDGEPRVKLEKKF
jgi:ribosomal protein S18 acetylase RimI-like enzyme